jgi:predicted hydrocarbon binding protein
MQSEPYSTNHLLFYPGARLTPAERARMDRYEIPIDEITTDHLVYGMSKQIENNFQSFYTVAEEVVGEEQALEIAKQIGRRYGGSGYAMFLRSQGRAEGDGSARMMALYQDLVHSLRGPKHAAALYATWDESRCVVKRRECIYFSEAAPQNGKYAGAFEAGCFEGYRAADSNLLRVEVRQCVWQGADGCEQHWVYEDDDEETSGAKQGSE